MREAIEDRLRRVLAEQALVEEQNARLSTLYVSGARLQAARGRDEVVGAIQDIVINLIGSEELAVFVVDAERRALHLAGAYGIEPAALAGVAMGEGIIGHAAERGERWIADDEPLPSHASPCEAGLTACVPLRVGTKVTGVVAIFRLLPQKAALEPGDDDLLALIETHAATALYLADVREPREEAGA